MRIQTYATLISGILMVMLMPSAFALEGGGYSDSGAWRPATPVDYRGFPAKAAGSQYRFRPMDRQRRAAAPMKWTYRPSRIDIPNHYVYRPLRVKHNRNATDQRISNAPRVPGTYDYGFKPRDSRYHGYRPFRAPSYDAYRYHDRNQRYAAERSTGRYTGQPMARRYSYLRDYSASRYAGRMPSGGYVFRPLDRPGRDAYRYRGQPRRYSANPYPVPGYQHRVPGWDYRYAMQQPIQRPNMPNRYGVDWYDGRGDGEGAWYQLAGQQEWPRVSHYSPLD
jgi:hypothetical protein